MKYNKGFIRIGVIIAIILLIFGSVFYILKTKIYSLQNIRESNYPLVEKNYTSSLNKINNNTLNKSSSPTFTTCNSSSPSTIKVLSPNGGEVYQAGQQIIVKWESCNITPNSIGIILIKHNISTTYTQSEEQSDYAGFSLGNYSTVDDGLEQITLPVSLNNNLVSGQYYFINVIGLGDNTHIGSGYTPKDYSDGLFTIISSY